MTFNKLLLKWINLSYVAICNNNIRTYKVNLVVKREEKSKSRE